MTHSNAPRPRAKATSHPAATSTPRTDTPHYRPPLAALAWLGRQGPRAVAAVLVIGIALPPLGGLLRPYVPQAIFALLVLSFSRVDMAALRGHLRRPRLALAAIAWTAIAVPLLTGLLARAAGLPATAPGLYLGIVLHGMTSPLVSVPALAALLGLDATLVLIALVAGTALVPFTAPAFAYLLLDGVLALSPTALGLKLAALLLGSLAVAAIIRRIAGARAIERHAALANGLTIVLLFVFVAAVMGDVASQALAHPTKTAAFLAAAFAVFFGLMALTAAIFRNAGANPALSVGFMTSQRNMGLMLAATGGVLPADTWLYFALSQFPVYLSPLLLRPIIKRFQPH